MGNSDHCSTPIEEEDNQGLLCKLNNIKDDDDQERVIDGDDEGYKTPTKREHRIVVDLRCPPPAPKKPKAQLMKRRRPSLRNLFQVSPEDIELLFPPRSVVVRERDTLMNLGSSIDPSAAAAANIKKVNNKANYTTTPLMSLR